jgi:hypothetical protein
MFMTRLSLALVLFACAFQGHAATNGFIVPPFRGSSQARAGYWETFSAAVGGAGNGADRPGATTAARLWQTDPAAFLTGSGNIYNLDGTSAFVISNTTPFTLGTVVLQTRTLGTELDYASPLLTFTNASGPQAVAPVARVELNRGTQPGLGATVSTLWQWNLTGSNVASYAITFRAAGPSTSFDAMTLDEAASFAPLFHPPFSVHDTTPVIERWMYPHNSAPCDRTAGAVFGTLSPDSGVDSRHAQQLLGWDTAAVVPTNRGPANYLVRRARITLTINRGNLFAYDPTQDSWRTYLATNDPLYLADNDAGRPIELFGAAFRNGFTAATFDQCAPFGPAAPGQRNAYAVGWSTNGMLVDVSNNVGKTNDSFPRFEVTPFAIGQTTNAAPGGLVPAGAKITFDLNLADPLVLAYVQAALDSGRLRVSVTSLHGTAGQFGNAAYPDFVTHFNEAVLEPTRLELEGVVLGTGDLDRDGLPDEWELFHWNALTHGSAADPDGDAASNLAELRAGTNPADSMSRLRFTTAARAGAATLLRFPHAASRQYAVEYTSDFSQWTSLTNAPMFDLPSSTVTWRDDSAVTNRFYRVRVTQP